jgi:hypothetical protein
MDVAVELDSWTNSGTNSVTVRVGAGSTCVEQPADVFGIKKALELGWPRVHGVEAFVGNPAT